MLSKRKRKKSTDIISLQIKQKISTAEMIPTITNQTNNQWAFEYCLYSAGYTEKLLFQQILVWKTLRFLSSLISQWKLLLFFMLSHHYLRGNCARLTMTSIGVVWNHYSWVLHCHGNTEALLEANIIYWQNVKRKTIFAAKKRRAV